MQEDAQGRGQLVQGGHVEYFKYMVQLLKERGGEHIQVFGGGGGVIVPPRSAPGRPWRAHLQPETASVLGLAGMIGEMVMRATAT